MHATPRQASTQNTCLFFKKNIFYRSSLRHAPPANTGSGSGILVAMHGPSRSPDSAVGVDAAPNAEVVSSNPTEKRVRMPRSRVRTRPGSCLFLKPTSSEPDVGTTYGRVGTSYSGETCARFRVGTSRFFFWLGSGPEPEFYSGTNPKNSMRNMPQQMRPDGRDFFKQGGGGGGGLGNLRPRQMSWV